MEYVESTIVEADRRILGEEKGFVRDPTALWLVVNFRTRENLVLLGGFTECEVSQCSKREEFSLMAYPTIFHWNRPISGDPDLTENKYLEFDDTHQEDGYWYYRICIFIEDERAWDSGRGYLIKREGPTLLEEGKDLCMVLNNWDGYASSQSEPMKIPFADIYDAYSRYKNR